MSRSIGLMRAAMLMSATGCAGLAHGQSGVTIYGVVDLPIAYINNQAASAPTINPITGAVTRQPGASFVSMVNAGGMSGSRWGLRGVEDLGADLKALFVLESGYGADTGQVTRSGAMFSRAAYVGLQSSRFGRITLGRQNTSMYESLGNFMPAKFAPLFEPSVALLGGTAGGGAIDNAVKYTAVAGPVTVRVHYSFGAGLSKFGLTPVAAQGAGETPGHATDNTAYGAGLAYLGAGLGLTATYDQWNPAVVAGSTGTSKKAALAASYAFGRTKLMAGYRWGQNKDASGSTLVRDNFWWTGVNYDATSALTLTLGYYFDDRRILKTTAVQPNSNPVNPWQVNFIADYSFSKRTDVYLTVAYARNSGLNLDSPAIGFANGAFLGEGANSQTGAAIGIRHKF
ncbi:porin [Cupriavidus taiwanensis]|uniref:porin n=1 Tax=Cupriavidus taiwanensis TaxID=164546 RepID=UPI000E1092A2|nr:porin [Cupriavidus taiwanensis]SOY67102.1 Outer membrane protein (Porin) [Cupriavidus taiwanensis]SOY67166.1 Outer membrane protein (Porin) [Cupriavidus taiwanensis]SOY94822.1 Outer membrane protein (Porin) [Cupriavidus taiwanensis]SOZ71736.1 Outer membrane protein (Porin) [Cupriavidus taiwanensis]SOZ86983.1 Outer membrane protein (Porin) [Cupriavidus taiwanensis]